MVLESLVNPVKAYGRPWVIVALGAMYTSIAIALAAGVFFSESSLLFVFLTAFACMPLMLAIIRKEEEKDLLDMSEKWLLKEHARALSVFMLLFLGIVLACALWFVILPSSTTEALFSTQMNTFYTINPSSTSSTVTGAVSSPLGHFNSILLNNLRVLVFCIIFSFLYGAGAIFVLTWNASVIGFAIGNIIRSRLADLAHLVGFEKGAQYFHVVAYGLFKYVIHGVPEILAYFVGGLAGGIISVAVIRHDFSSRKFEHILLDSADLLLIAIGLLILAASLEVWVTPLVFR
jgi:uncharacterized membrane protein SpoIIM required for sporulation